MEDLAYTIWSRDGKLNIRLIDSNDEEFVVNLTRVDGTYDVPANTEDTFECDFDIVGWSTAYSFHRGRSCPENDAEWWFEDATVHEFTNHKANSIDNNTSNSMYPSVGAVREYIANNQVPGSYSHDDGSYDQPLVFSQLQKGMHLLNTGCFNSTLLYYKRTPDDIRRTISLVGNPIMLYVVNTWNELQSMSGNQTFAVLLIMNQDENPNGERFYGDLITQKIMYNNGTISNSIPYYGGSSRRAISFLTKANQYILGLQQEKASIYLYR